MACRGAEPGRLCREYWRYALDVDQGHLQERHAPGHQ